MSKSGSSTLPFKKLFEDEEAEELTEQFKNQEIESPLQLSSSVPDSSTNYFQPLNLDALNSLEHHTYSGDYTKTSDSQRYPKNYDENYSVSYSDVFGKQDKGPNYLPTHSWTQTNNYNTFSSDNLSEFDVILENGNKVKRSISLTSGHEKSPFLAKDTLPSLQRAVENSPVEPRPKTFFEKHLTPQNKKVLKSILSYFVGSMLTFIPILRSTIGTSSHMAAISGFFLNPGQSLGTFIESMAFGLAFVIYGLLVGALSLANMTLWNIVGFPYFGRVSTLLIFIGLGSFILAYIKANFPKPTVIKCIPNAFIIMYIVLINYTPFAGDEFNFYKIFDLGKSLFSGIIINFIICTQIWPNWEADNLRKDMLTSLDSFQRTLSVIVKTFLLEEVVDAKDGDIDKMLESHRKSFLTLKQRYDNAKFEFHLEPEKYKCMGKVIDRLNRLSQKLGGLSSGIDAQKDLLGANTSSINKSYAKFNNRRSKLNKLRNQRIGMKRDTFHPGSIKPIQESHNTNNESAQNEEQEPDIEVLFNFLSYVGPPTKSLAFTCKRAILELNKIISSLSSATDRPIFKQVPETESTNSTNTSYISPTQLKENIQSALDLFSKSQSKAMGTLYKRTQYDGRPGEEVFLVYFFVFSLEEFASELQLTIAAIDELAHAPTFSSTRWWSNFKLEVTASWFAFSSLLKRIGTFNVEEVPNPNFNRAEEPLHNPAPQTMYQRVRASFWYFLMSLRDHKLIFAIKSATAALLVASPAYIFEYRDLFKQWRVGWTLITINLVMSPTVGASNLYGIYRLSGTLVGSIIAYLVYTIFSHDQFALIVVSTLVAAPSFYIFLNTGYPRFGQFLLLSYNLIVLTTYANRHDVEFDFAEYAFIRAFSVSLGVVIGLIFSFMILPYEARRELRRELSVFFLELVNLYMKLLQVYVSPDVPSNESTINAPLTKNSPHFDTVKLTSTLSADKFQNEDPTYLSDVSEFLELELKIQLKLLDLGSLLSNTVHEPRLKGPFPHQTYHKILKSCQFVLDKFVAMRIVITKEEWRTRVVRDFVIPLNKYRTELAGSIILYFYLLASVLHLKSPLPPYLPPAAQARRRLIKALRELPVVRSRLLYQDDDHHICYYAFVVVLDDIISELDILGLHFKSLYGAMDDVAFNNLFKVQNDNNQV